MDKKKVNLKVVNNQYTEKLVPKGEAYERQLDLDDRIEVQAEGDVYFKDESFYVAYDEYLVEGAKSVKCVIKASPRKGGSGQSLRIKRFTGKEEVGAMDLSLEEGVMNIIKYATPIGSIDIEVYTNKVAVDIDDDGFGTMLGDYTMRFSGDMPIRNKIEITISEHTGA